MDCDISILPRVAFTGAEGDMASNGLVKLDHRSQSKSTVLLSLMEVRNKVLGGGDGKMITSRQLLGCDMDAVVAST